MMGSKTSELVLGICDSIVINTNTDNKVKIDIYHTEYDYVNNKLSDRHHYVCSYNPFNVRIIAKSHCRYIAVVQSQFCIVEQSVLDKLESALIKRIENYYQSIVDKHSS